MGVSLVKLSHNDVYDKLYKSSSKLKLPLLSCLVFSPVLPGPLSFLSFHLPLFHSCKVGVGRGVVRGDVQDGEGTSVRRGCGNL